MEILNQCKQDISNGDSEQAIKKLLSISWPSFYEEQIISISSRYQKLKVNEIKGVISREDINIETNRINASVLSFINEVIDGHVKFNDDPNNNEIKLSSEILQVANQLYKENDNKPIPALQEKGKAVLQNIEETIENIINDMEENGVSYINQGKIMAIAENLNNILNGKVDGGVIKNLSNSIDRAKYSRASAFEDASKKKEAIFALQMTKGYLSALIDVS